MLGALAALVASVGLAVGAAGQHAVARTTAATTTTCPITVALGEHLGPSYVTSVTATGVSCAGAMLVVKAFYACRVAAGGPSGHCHRSVLGYRCAETRTGISIQFDARVSCVDGRRTVLHTYVQNT